MDSTKTWAQYEQLVRWTTWRIAKRYNYDFEELYSEALVLYTQAVQSFDECNGSASNWIRFRIYKGLQEVVRTRARRLNITGPISNELSRVADSEDSFIATLWKEVSTDAQQALGILFDLDVSKLLNQSKVKLRWRVALMDLRWTPDRIESCFAEIDAALA